MNASIERREAPLAYVLHLMDPEERRAMTALLLDDPDLAGEAWDWEEALAPLAAALPPRRPPRRVAAALERTLFGPSDRVVRQARRRARFWRHAAGLFATVSLILLVLIIWVFVDPSVRT